MIFCSPVDQVVRACPSSALVSTGERAVCFSVDAFWFGLRYQFIPECGPADCDSNACSSAQCDAPTSGFTCTDYQWVNYDVTVSTPHNQSCSSAGSSIGLK